MPAIRGGSLRRSHQLERFSRIPRYDWQVLLWCSEIALQLLYRFLWFAHFRRFCRNAFLSSAGPNDGCQCSACYQLDVSATKIHSSTPQPTALCCPPSLAPFPLGMPPPGQADRERAFDHRAFLIHKQALARAEARRSRGAVPVAATESCLPLNYYKLAGFEANELEPRDMRHSYEAWGRRGLFVNSPPPLPLPPVGLSISPLAYITPPSFLPRLPPPPPQYLSLVHPPPRRPSLVPPQGCRSHRRPALLPKGSRSSPLQGRRFPRHPSSSPRQIMFRQVASETAFSASPWVVALGAEAAAASSA